MRLFKLSYIVVFLQTLNGPLAAADGYTAEVEKWRSQRLARLTAPDGWLTLIGLYWLKPGDNSIGSAH
jgi:uncharacterized protein